jgi:ribosome-associated heat shock protein Hsp15
MTDPAADQNDTTTATPAGSQRLDKWLWFARVIKTRTQAAGLVTEGKVRINSIRCEKPAHAVRVGDVLTIIVGDRIRILQVVLPGAKRGGAPEAALLFKDLTPPPVPRAQQTAAPGARDEGSGRPTKRDRRVLDRLRERQQRED